MKKRSVVIGLTLIILIISSLYVNQLLININAQKQVIKLQDSISEINSKITRIGYRPLVIPYSSKLALGDTYKALIFTAMLDTIEHGKVMVTDPSNLNEGVQPTEKPLLFNEFYQAYEYSFTPKKKGSYTWRGRAMVTSLNGQKRKLPFIQKYVVE